MDEDESQIDLEELVLAHVLNPRYQPVKPRVIAKKLGLPRERRDQLKRVIKRLTRAGRLAYGKNHLVRPPSAAGEKQTPATRGIFRRAARGFGFVRPENTLRDSETQDIYIPASKTSDAANGDLVAVRLKGKRRKGERLLWAGEIAEVIQRHKHQFVGTYFERAGLGFVQVDGTAFGNPIYVGDPGAKRASPSDKVVVEMVRFPSAGHDGEAVITEVLGPRGQPGVDTLSIIHEFDLPRDFPEEVLDESRKVAEEFDESLSPDRLDLTALPVVTIDPRDARDFDDAISLQRCDQEHWKLGVHIADVSYFVRRKSKLDREARQRATSVYLPDRVIPMLPEVISNNLASLQPHRVRFAKTVFIEFTPDGARVATEAHRSAIESDRRFSYEEVDDFLADPDPWKERLSPEVHRLLTGMHTLAMILRKRRLERGAIELSLPEVKVDLDKNGCVEGAHLVENTESHQIIEEFMLAANEAVADWLHEQELHFLRRIHEDPDPRKLKQLSGFVRELGIDCESLESRFEIRRVVEQVRGQPEAHAVNLAILRSMAKARYGPEQTGHYALHFKNYCHFTSPIRRYPDLTIHRMVDDLIAGRRPVAEFDAQMLLGEHCSAQEQRAEEAERELTKLKLLDYMAQRVGQELDAVVTGVERYGIFAQGTKLPVDGFIHVDQLQDDHYEFDRQAHRLVGRRSGNKFQLGEVIRVQIAHVDLQRRQLDFRLPSSSSGSASERQQGSGNRSTNSGTKRNSRKRRR